jgi:ribose-phosphate pyrophosphokinase
MKLIAGNSNLPLAQEISQLLGLPLVDATIKRFADNEIFVKINESVRGEDVFVIQSLSFPTNDNLMELLIIQDALKRASARKITSVIPYYGYARQDRLASPRTPISAKLVADILTVSGAHRVLTLDLHAGQIQGFFNIPVDNLFSTPVFEEFAHRQYQTLDKIIISPDIGGLARARALAKKFNLDLAIVDKRREKAGLSEVVNIIGDIDKKDCIIVDDIVDSAGTLCNAADALMQKGAKSVRALITHGIFSRDAIEKIEQSNIVEVVVTNSILNSGRLQHNKKIKVISIAALFAEAIRRIVDEKSVSSLFEK